MTEYVVMHVLRLHRDMPGYQAAQTNREWRRTTIVRAIALAARLDAGSA
jgi:glyoxylate/hydroxypyruvate reductase A